MSYENLDTKPKTRLSSYSDDESRRQSVAMAAGESRQDGDFPTSNYLSLKRQSQDKYDRLVVANPYVRHGSFGGMSVHSGGLLSPSGGVALRRASFIPGVWETYPSSTTVDQKDVEGSSAINSYNLSSYHTMPSEYQSNGEQEITKRRALKNVVILGLAFVFVYSAFISLQSLKSTMHSKSGLGVVSLSCVYATTVISCFLAPWIIKRVSTKWTLVVAFILFSAYFTTHYYPFPEMIIPSSIILGFAAGPLWGAQATYITTLAVKYSQTTGQDADYLVNKFLCLFCGLYQTSQIWGNLISVLLIVSTTGQSNSVHPSQHRILNPESGIQDYIRQYYVDVPDVSDGVLHYVANSTGHRPQCGVMSCVEPGDTGLIGAPDYGQLVEVIPQTTVYLLVSIYLGCGVMAIVIATALLERFDTAPKHDLYNVTLTGRELCSNTWDMLKDFKCQMLIPLIIFVGMQQAFMFGDFTKFYINCTLGVKRIGEIFICFGTVSALSAITIGYISKHIKRIAIVTAGAVFNIGLLLVLWLWRPLPIDLPNFFVVSGCLGLCDAIWQTQTYTLFGVLFVDRQEAAFSTYRMFLSTGCALAFGYSHYLCVEIKVYILGAVLIISLMLYSVIEVKLQWQSQHIRDIVAL